MSYQTSDSKMFTERVKFGFRRKGKLEGILTYFTHSNDGGDCCVSQEHVINTYSDSGEQEWLCDSYEHADWVLHNPTPWFNAGYETPNHHLNPEEIEIVRVTQQITVEPCETDEPIMWLVHDTKYDPNFKIVFPDDSIPKRLVKAKGHLSTLTQRYPRAQVVAEVSKNG